jgi:hypothetical protein
MRCLEEWLKQILPFLEARLEESTAKDTYVALKNDPWQRITHELLTAEKCQVWTVHNVR